MTTLYKQLTSCKPSQADDAYILKILPSTGKGIAAITSADELLIIDATNFESTKPLRLEYPGKGVTSLTSDNEGNHFFCGGADGVVSCFDMRSQRKVAKLEISKPITALTVNAHDLAVGTEQQHQQAVVAVWDIRHQTMRWQNTENNDDITALDFHSTKPNILLSGGDDGLVSIFDTNIQEEEDSLTQAFNHGPIHKAGFVDAEAVYALSSDQNLAIHPIFDDRRDQEPQPIQLGDVRPLVPCEYVIDLLHIGQEFVLATGSYSKSQVNILSIRNGRLDLDTRIALQGAHGGEIVRSLFVDSDNGIVFTAGEDGWIKAFGQSETKETSVAAAKATKAKQSSDGRYKPY